MEKLIESEILTTSMDNITMDAALNFTTDDYLSTTLQAANEVQNRDRTLYPEAARYLNIIVRPILLVMGTFGNCISFYIMVRGSLRTIPTCFYLALLSVADTGEFLNYFLSEQDFPGPKRFG